jgi:hypothetical protein
MLGSEGLGKDPQLLTGDAAAVLLLWEVFGVKIMQAQPVLICGKKLGSIIWSSEPGNSWSDCRRLVRNMGVAGRLLTKLLGRVSDELRNCE